ncbi:MAG: glycerol kinase GlpK [Methylobacteriaceae bacterium]|nr:glycerol kinase GlpK [Methylobacteriaceae bacterium]
MQACVLVIDQGTTSTRAIVFGADAVPLASAQQEFRQIFPRPGWVEHDPQDLWATTLATAREALRTAGVEAANLAGLGIANQRETVLVWERATGRPVHNAIVWQDRRTADRCLELRAEGHDALIARKAGLLLDPYFSATKIAWILDHVEGARAQAKRGELAFGTVDTFLLWQLTDGAVYATDATNASRTLLFDIHSGRWDDELAGLFGVPLSMLPEVRDSAAEFGLASAGHFGAPVAIRGIAGDQQAALMGQACFEPGMAKSTYGTGCFLLLNTGARAIASHNRLLTTIAYQWHGQRTYALEGSIFSAGATVQWLRDGLGVLGSAAESGELAAVADRNQPVYLVPAFTGLGAPHWDSEARASITGITRGTTHRELARAALESVAYQTRDLLEAMHADVAGGSGEGAGSTIRVDGGMSASDWTMQFLADTLNAPVDRPKILETTALGAAFLAGWQAGVYPDPQDFSRTWQLERRFRPSMDQAERETRYRGWREAVARTVARPRL